MTTEDKPSPAIFERAKAIRKQAIELFASEYDKTDRHFMSWHFRRGELSPADERAVRAIEKALQDGAGFAAIGDIAQVIADGIYGPGFEANEEQWDHCETIATAIRALKPATSVEAAGGASCSKCGNPNRMMCDCSLPSLFGAAPVSREAVARLSAHSRRMREEANMDDRAAAHTQNPDAEVHFRSNAISKREHAEDIDAILAGIGDGVR